MIIPRIIAAADNYSVTQYQTGLPQATQTTNDLQTILQIAFGILGGLSLLYIVVGALKMVNSQGNPQTVAKARNTIVYAVVGVLVALAAESIVTFALNNI